MKLSALLLTCALVPFSGTAQDVAGEAVTLSAPDLVQATGEAVTLRVTPHFTTSDHGNGSTPSHQVLNLAVDLEGASAPALVEGRLHYILVGRNMNNENRYKVLAIHSAPFGLTAGQPTKVSFKTVKNYYQSSKGARCIGYVLYASHKDDGRLLFSSGSTPLLEKAVEAIISLKIGEETDQNFAPLSTRGLQDAREVTKN